MTEFTARDAARILDLSEARVRAWVRAGYVRRRRGEARLSLTFQDLLVLRTVKGLMDSGVAPQRVARLIRSLRRQLPSGVPLSSLSVYADGRRIVVWDGTARWEPDSGQFQFHFAASDVADAAPAEIALDVGSTPDHDPPAVEQGLTAEHWFDLACELEGQSSEEARRAYHQALAMDSDLVEAHVNLGRMYHESGELAKADAHYRAAARLDPRDAVVWFNLGVLCEDARKPAQAVTFYKRAVAVDPEFADAHFNLGLLLDAVGRRSEAMGHLMKARRLMAR
jgi:tetratricopeptide (TPR) repeat protein